MRFLKKLFSRFTFVALTIILLFSAFALAIVGGFWLLRMFLIERFESARIWIWIAAEVINWLVVVLTIIHIVNRDMTPETKLPWIICVVALGVFGVGVYAFFSYNRPSKRQRRYFRALHKDFDAYIARAVSEEKLARDMGDWAGVSEAVYRKNPVAVMHANTKTEYFPTGEKFFERLLFDLERAEKYIFMEYFVVGRGQVWSAVLDVLKRKVQEGVEVRFLYDDIGCMGKIHFRYDKTLRKLGINCVKFNPFVPVVSNVHNNRDHRKLTVIDGKVGYTGGANIADEYANLARPFGYWKDTAVRLEGEAVRNLIVSFLRTFNMQRRTTEDFTPYIPPSYDEVEGEGYVQPYSDGPKPLYANTVAEDVYLDILATAKKYVWITTPYLIIDYRIRTALLSAAARGVDVRILTPHIPDKKIPFALTRSNYMALIKGGVKIYEYTPGFVHAKSFLADDDIAVVGTVNLDYRSLLYHYENAVLLYRTRACAQLKEDLEGCFACSKLQTEEDAKKNILWRGLTELAKAFAPLF